MRQWHDCLALRAVQSKELTCFNEFLIQCKVEISVGHSGLLSQFMSDIDVITGLLVVKVLGGWRLDGLKV